MSILCNGKLYPIKDIPLEIVYNILFFKKIKFIWEPIFIPQRYEQDIIKTKAKNILSIYQDYFIGRCFNSVIFLPIIIYLLSLFFIYKMLFMDYVIAVSLITSISLLYFLIDRVMQKSMQKSVEKEKLK